jgi:hypothetical protein
MQKPFTVVWTPAGEDTSRLDHVMSEPRQADIMTAAAQIVIREAEYSRDEVPQTTDEVLNGVGEFASRYELAAIFDGHIKDAVLEG